MYEKSPIITTKNIRSFIKRISKTIKKSEYGVLIILVSFLAVAVLFELFVFNFRHWQTLFHEPLNREPVFAEGYSLNGDGSYHFSEGDTDILIYDIPGNTHQLYINFTYVDENGEMQNRPVGMYFKISDRGNGVEYEAGHRDVCYGVERSFYASISSYGDIRTLRIEPQIDNNSNLFISINENVKIPIFFEVKRVIFAFAVLLFLYFFRPNSHFYGIQYLDIKKQKRMILLISIIMINYVSLYGFGDLNKTARMESGEPTDHQYHQLAESFKNGKLSLEIEPSESLLNMEDPYDFLTRAENGVEAQYDTSYYDGKYYVYFGVIPEIVFYYPYYLIKGEHLDNYIVIKLCLVVILIASYLAFEEMIKRYYPKCSLPFFVLLYELSVISSNIMYSAKRSHIYNVPIICAIMFALLGVWAFLRSVPTKEGKPLNLSFLALGSFFTALVAGCRPQLFVIFLIDIVIIRKYVFSLKYLKTREGIKTAVCILVPMVAVAAGIMAYNALRFDSIFDFGSNYNLTIDNLTKKKPNLSFVIHGLVVYLFKPLNLTSAYPFFDKIDLSTVFLGKNIETETFGGIFLSFPFLLMPAVGILNRRYLKDNSRGFYLAAVVSLLLGAMICLIDTALGGIYYRYTMDITLFFTVSAVSVSIGLVNSKIMKNKFIRNNLVYILLVIFLFEFIYCMCTKLSDEQFHTLTIRQDLFYKYMFMYGFWM